jgi:MFS family permease
LTTVAPRTELADLAPEPDGIPALTHRQILVIMSGLMLGMFLATLDQTIVGTALPTIAGDFHRQDLLSWVVTVYLLTSTISTPLYGKASDLYGRKRVLQLSIVIFLIGSALCGIAQSMGQLIAFRALQGLGAGGLMSLALAVIADIIPPRERGRYQGYFGAVFVSSSLIGPLLGGFFVDNASWRWVFYINLPLGLLALVVTNRVLTMPFTQRKVSIDWAGAGLLVAGISALLVAVQSGGRDFAWTSGEMAILVTAGVLLVVAFVVRERSAVEPILPPRLFGNGSFRVASSIGFVSGAVMFGTILFIPQYLQLVRGESATVSAVHLHHLGTAHQPYRALQDLHRERNLHPHGGPDLDDAALGNHSDPRTHGVDVRRGIRHGCVHADPRNGDAERCGNPGPGRRHLLDHVLSHDGRRHRRCRLRCLPDQPAHLRAAQASACSHRSLDRAQHQQPDHQPGCGACLTRGGAPRHWAGLQHRTVGRLSHDDPAGCGLCGAVVHDSRAEAA